jgi:hypothetical protein
MQKQIGSGSVTTACANSYTITEAGGVTSFNIFVGFYNMSVFSFHNKKSSLKLVFVE